jgi:uncharacterized membrane protein YeiH
VIGVPVGGVKGMAVSVFVGSAASVHCSHCLFLVLSSLEIGIFVGVHGGTIVDVLVSSVVSVFQSGVCNWCSCRWN